MHLPEGVLAGHSEIGTAIVAVGALGYAAHRARMARTEIDPVLVGVTAAGVFALQMCNFPVAGGTSGHLLGAIFAAVMLGPWLGMLSVSSVIMVQSLLFADGGLTTMGANVLNMAIVPIVVGYPLYLLLRRAWTSRTGVIAAAGVASMVSVVAAAGAFSFEYAIGGVGPAASTVISPMLGIHVLVGLGEAAITMAALALVFAWRPAAIPTPIPARVEVTR
jgi:cobalt/nickel transport system permease protein